MYRKKVKLIGDGSTENPFRPEVNEGVNYSIKKYFQDGYVEIELETGQKLAELEELIEVLIIDSLEGNNV